MLGSWLDLEIVSPRLEFNEGQTEFGSRCLVANRMRQGWKSQFRLQRIQSILFSAGCWCGCWCCWCRLQNRNTQQGEEYIIHIWGFPQSWGYPNSWMVQIWKSNKIDESWGYPHLIRKPPYIYIYITQITHSVQNLYPIPHVHLYRFTFFFLK